MDLNESFSSFNPKGDYQYYKENAPPGYRFDGTDDLMLSYLISKEQGDRLANLLFKEVPLYDCNPEELQCQFNNGKEEEFYVYAETKPLNNGLRVERKAGDGRWRTMIGERKITRGGKTVGCKTTFSFYRGKEGKEKKTCWNMLEYRLHRENRKRKLRDNLVLCKIYKRRSFEKSCEALNEEDTLISLIANKKIDAGIDSCNSPQSPTFVPNGSQQIVSDVSSSEINNQIPETADDNEYWLQLLMEDVN